MVKVQSLFLNLVEIWPYCEHWKWLTAQGWSGQHQGELDCAYSSRQHPWDIKHQQNWPCLAHFSGTWLWNGDTFWCEHTASFYFERVLVVCRALEPFCPLSHRSLYGGEPGSSLRENTMCISSSLGLKQKAWQPLAIHATPTLLSGSWDSTFLLLEAVL